MKATAYRIDHNEQAYTNNPSYTQNQEGVIVDFEEYRKRRQARQKRKSIQHKKKISVWGAIIAGIGGFLAAAGLVALLGLVQEKAVFVLYVSWLFFGGVLACFFDDMGV
jgi:hypothetical protein